MIEVLEWNRLDEASSWLSEQNNSAWTPSRLLNAIYVLGLEKSRRQYRKEIDAGLPLHLMSGGNIETEIRAAPPATCTFISHKLFPEPDELPCFSVPWRSVPLRLDQVGQLLAAGSILLSHAGDRHDEVNAKGTSVRAEEIRPPALITWDAVGIRAQELRSLHRQLASGTASNSVVPLRLVHDDSRAEPTRGERIAAALESIKQPDRTPHGQVKWKSSTTARHFVAAYEALNAAGAKLPEALDLIAARWGCGAGSSLRKRLTECRKLLAGSRNGKKSATG
ncbi:MAG: hypothetical protein RIQ60_2602 [Pseudomonadota bacterium]|jgi:hypothetical protein